MAANLFRGDYETLAQIAQRFACEQEEAQRTLESLQKHVNMLQGGDWVGEGANAFYAEMNGDVLPSVRRLAAALKSAQRTAMQISREIKQAEDEAAAVLRDTGATYEPSRGNNWEPPKFEQPAQKSNPPEWLEVPCKSSTVLEWLVCKGLLPQPNEPQWLRPLVSSDGQYELSAGPAGTLMITNRSNGQQQAIANPPGNGGDFKAMLIAALVALGAGLVYAVMTALRWLASEINPPEAKHSQAEGAEPAVVNPPQSQEAINQAIDKDLQSTDDEVRLPAEVADYLRKQGAKVVSYNRIYKNPKNGQDLGDIDVETEDVIIEVTNGKSNKTKQIEREKSDPVMNPSGKPVILYGPRFKYRALKNVLDNTGVPTAKTLDELYETLNKLKQRKP